MSAAVPTQLATWMSHHVLGDDERTDDPQFLYALCATTEGDRQVIWEGGGGRGIVAVVDFSHHQMHGGTRWFAWGRSSMLTVPVGPEALRTVPELNERFFGRNRTSLQGGVLGLPEAEAAAIDQLAGGLPPQRLPQRPPQIGEPLHRWLGRIGIDPEKTFELAVHTSPLLWRELGFPEPPTMQVRLDSPGRRTDIIDLYSPGIIGEVKRVVTARDGPDQVARYLARLNRERRELGPWRAVLIQGAERLNPAARQRLDELGLPIEVWAVTRGLHGHWKARQLYDGEGCSMSGRWVMLRGLLDA